MPFRKLFLIIYFLGLLIVFFTGCSPTSYSIRYNNNFGLKTYDDSVKVGLIVPSDDELIYYSQVQDTSSEFQSWDIDDEESTSADPDIDISLALERIKSKVNGYDTNFTDTTPKERLLMEIIKYLNTPYKYGGNSENGIDCSAFTKNVFSSSLNIDLFRSAREQFSQGLPIRNINDLMFGDLVFFNTRRAVRPGHVGIYLGDDLFAHASSTKGVTVSSIDGRYYSKRFMGGRRINESFTKIN